MHEFEDDVRRALHHQPSDGTVDADSLLADVHRGALRRRTKRTVASAAAAVAVIAGGGYAVTTTGLLDSNDGQTATGPATSSSDNRGSTATSELTTRTATSTNPTGPVTISPASDLSADEVMPISLTATGTEHQFVLASTPGRDCAGYRCSTVFETRDAGDSWQTLGQLPLPPGSGDGPHEVSQLRFVGTGEDGWAYGGGLLVTHDGGRSWTEPTLPAYGVVTELAAWGGYVYAALDGPQVGEPVRLVRSPVDRDDWQLVDTGTPLTSVSSLVVSDQLVAMLDSPADGALQPLLTSTDGNTWARIQVCPAGYWPDQLSTAEGAMWVVCAPNGPQVQIRVTTDAGQTWSTVPGSLGQNITLAARSADDALVVGPDVDGITLVSTAAEPTRLAAQLPDVTTFGFTNSQTGYELSTTGTIWRTADGGAHWSAYTVTP